MDQTTVAGMTSLTDARRRRPPSASISLRYYSSPLHSRISQLYLEPRSCSYLHESSQCNDWPTWVPSRAQIRLFPVQHIPGAGQSTRSVKLSTHIYLVRRWKMCRSLPPLPHTGSWRGASLGTGTTLFLWCSWTCESLAVWIGLQGAKSSDPYELATSDKHSLGQVIKRILSVITCT
jgi:hypothetical protein